MVGAAALPWSLKLVNGFLIDRYTFLPMGRRRSWMLLSQFAVVLALIQMALADPAQDVVHVAVLAILLAFAAATQDIALDAWRIESTPADKAGPLTGAFQIGYRIALIAAGAGALFAAAETARSAMSAAPLGWSIASVAWPPIFGEA